MMIIIMLRSKVASVISTEIRSSVDVALGGGGEGTLCECEVEDYLQCLRVSYELTSLFPHYEVVNVIG